MAKKRGSRAGQPKPLVPSAMKSLKRARHVTSEFHRIQRELDVVAGDSRDGTPSARARADRQRLERQLDSIGGRQAYQEASVLTTARHRTCKWVFAVLTKLGMRPRKNQSPLRVLEIGAVNTQLLSVPWLDVRAIDIKSQHPRIEQVDFFDVPPKGDKDVVVCAMVLNCVESAVKRGRMLADARRHLKPAGIFSSCSRGGASSARRSARCPFWSKSWSSSACAWWRRRPRRRCSSRARGASNKNRTARRSPSGSRTRRAKSADEKNEEERRTR